MVLALHHYLHQVRVHFGYYRYLAGYTNHAVDTGNAAVVAQLEAVLQELDNTVGSEVVPKLAHPESLARNIDELMEVATNNNDMMHGVVRGIVEAMNGLYEQGPLKKQDRVMEKAEGDYEGNFLQVIDIVRSSAVFHALGRSTGGNSADLWIGAAAGGKVALFRKRRPREAWYR